MAEEPAWTVTGTTRLGRDRVRVEVGWGDGRHSYLTVRPDQTTREQLAPLVAVLAAHLARARPPVPPGEV